MLFAVSAMPGSVLVASTLSSQISRQYGYISLGQSMRQGLYRAWHTTVSRTMHGVFISTIFDVFSSMSLVTRFNTRYVPPQYGTSSASQYIPRFLLLVSTVF